jgi:hypothetical protein
MPEHLAHELLGMWAWGALSMRQVQKIALAAYKDMAQPGQVLSALAGLGKNGNIPGNIMRDFKNKVPAKTICEETLALITLNVAKGKNEGTKK